MARKSKGDGLRLRGGVWYIDITVPRALRARLGTSRIVRSTFTSDRQAAEAERDALRADLWSQRFRGDPPRVAWRAVVQQYLGSPQAKRLRTLEEIKDHLRWLDRHFGHLYLDEITWPVIDAVMDQKRAEWIGQKSSPRHPSEATINRYLADISRVLHFAAERGYIASVPRLKKTREEETVIRVLSHEQANRLLLELPPHLRALARFALATGLRQARVCFLRWDQIDLDARTLTIEATEAKNRRRRVKPLNEDAMEVLREQRGQHDVWVFPYKGPRDRHAHPIRQPAGSAWKKALRRAGIDPGFRWHDLRHTWATWHLKAGTPIEVLKELGDWRDLKMVLRYGHVAQEHMAKFADNVRVPAGAARLELVRKAV